MMPSFIHPTAIIYPNVTIEDGCYIGPYCVIGGPPEWKNKTESHGVLIRKNSTLTGLVTVDSGAEGRTIIGSGCYLMKHSHIGHDARLGNNVTVSCGAKVGGHSFIGHNCNLGLNSVIHQRQNISDGCMIGASAFVSKTLITEPYRKYAGVPAKDIGANIKA